MSFPSIIEPGGSKEGHSSSIAKVETLSYTTGLSNVAFHQPGATIYHRDNNRKFQAGYLLVESDDPSWSRSDDRTLRLRITPKRPGDFSVQIRGWLCAHEYTDCARHPESGAVKDQQGWFAEQLEILVDKPSTKARPVAAPTTAPAQVSQANAPAQSPFRLGWQASSSEIRAGESFTLTIRMRDIQQAGEHGGISVSFPSITEPGGSKKSHSSSVANVEALSYTTSLSNVAFHQPGATIYHRDNNRKFPAWYLLVESDDPSWSRSDDRTLRLRITPKRGGEFPIQIRGWICAHEYKDCTRHPESGMVEDQQGWAVIRTEPEVGHPNGVFAASPSDYSFNAASTLARFSTPDPWEGELRADAASEIIARYQSGAAEINRVLDLLQIMAPELSIDERRRAWDRLEQLAGDDELDAIEAASAVFYLGSLITGDEPNPRERIEAAQKIVSLYQAGELDPDSALNLMNTVAPGLSINERRQAAAALARLSADDDWDDADRMEAASEVFRLVTGVPLNAQGRADAAVDLASIGARIFDADGQFDDRDIDAATAIIKQSLTGELTDENLQYILGNEN